ncbi:MAG: glycosyltransferase family 4 protein [Candidatus Entotheonellia bacterium]
MRIGIMLQSLHHLGGIGTYTQQVVKHLVSIDKKNEYILLYPTFGKARQSFGQYRDYPNVTEVLSSSAVPHGHYWDHMVVPSAAKKYGVEILFNPFQSIPFRGQFKKIPVIHNSEWFTMPDVFWMLERYTGRLRIKAIMKTADLVISVSQKVAEDLMRATGLPGAKFRVIYNGASEAFRPIADASVLDAMKQKFGLPDEFVLFVGGIYPQKNFTGVLKAFHAISHRIPHHLVVAGNTRWKSGHDLEWIARLGIEKRVQLLGWVSHDDLAAIYNLATCFVIPSFHESCSVALLEAISCGCPVIASQTGGNPEIVADAALLIDPYDPLDLQQALFEALSNPDLRRDLARKGLERAKEFTWERCATETLKVFDECHAAGA